MTNGGGIHPPGMVPKAKSAAKQKSKKKKAAKGKLRKNKASSK